MDHERRIRPTKVEPTHIVVDGGIVYRARDANAWLEDISRADIEASTYLPPTTPRGREGNQRRTKVAPFSE